MFFSHSILSLSYDRSYKVNSIMLRIFIFIAITICGVFGDGRLTILRSPDAVVFKGNEKIESDVLGDIIGASLGYPIHRISEWDGLYVTDPFKTAQSAVLFFVTGANQLKFDDIKTTTYPVSGNHATESLDILGAQVQEQNGVSLDVDLDEGLSALEQHKEIFGELALKPVKATANLKPNSNKAHKEFLQKISIINAIADAAATIKLPSSTFLNLHVALDNLQQDDAPILAEAKALLTTSIVHLTEAYQKIDNNEILIAAFVSNSQTLIRSRRAAEAEKQNDINIAKDYSENYPVIFNIILWFSVVMIFTLLAISYAIAYMDPGRDSIIYRMTSNRIKKDN